MTDVTGRECSKKSVQQGRSHFDARSVLLVREHGKLATMSVRAASAKPENAAGGFFQHSQEVFLTVEGPGRIYQMRKKYILTTLVMLHTQHLFRLHILPWFAVVLCVLGFPQLASAQRDQPIQEEPAPLVATEMAPKDERVERVEMLLNQEQIDQALVILEDFVESGSTSPQADALTFLHAQALQAKGDTKQAIIILEQLLEEYPISSFMDEAGLLLGRLYIESQEANRAIIVLTNALNRSSNSSTHMNGLHLLRQAYELKGEFTKAVQMALKQMNATGEHERRELLDYIQGLILQRMDERTLGNMLETYTTTFPGDVALIRLIELHTAQGDEVLAERDIRAFLYRFPNHPYAQTAVALMQSFISKIKAHQYVIAAVLPFSGKMKPFGTDALNGIRLAMQEGRAEFGSNTLGIVVKDSALPPAQLHHVVEQVMREFEPIALIGPLLAQQVKTVADLPDWAEIPFITPTASISDVKQFGRYWFSTALTSRLQMTKLVEHAIRTLGFSRFCVLAPDSSYGKELANIFQEIVVRHGGEVIAAETFQRATTDASTQIKRLKNKDLSLYGEMLPMETAEPVKEGEEQLVYTPGFDAVFLPGHPTDVAFLSAQLAYFDIKVPLLGSNTWNHPDLLKWGRSTLNGSTFGDALFLQSTDPEVQGFVQKYREQFQEDPSIFAVQAYDAMRVILDTIKHGATTGPEVRDQLFIRHDFPILGGLTSFGGGGVLDRKVYMIQVANGRFIQIN
ncbi:MAG: penicillin-binding protein activator [Nitrospirae bacterium]|nr:penicillin-binding protein activator [Nitrospirota bacterium]